jgi:tRNA(adenine34) deaminase
MITAQDPNHFYMQQALREAYKAFEAGEVPVGAVIVMQNRIIARAFNQVETLSDCTAHAEMLALTSALGYLGSKYLMEASIYITLEPCVMCAGALYWSKIGRIVYAAQDEQHGYRSIHPGRSPFHPKTVVEQGPCSEESLQLIRDFFAARR